MDLTKKRELAARTLGIGVGRVMFNIQRIDEIKEAISKQDIRDLVADKAIFIRDIKGRKANTARKRRRAGSIRMKPNNRKREYIIITRKSRAYVAELRKQGKLTNEEFLKLRREIRSKQFKNKAHLKERITLMKNGGKK
ncbi:MAG: 50S ribosomal protein L19e [Candidatus Pacearchaeota archaeon]